MSNFVIGLTGGIGSGKTTVANEFEKLGIQLIDADLLAREVVEPGSPALIEIAKHFGSHILTHNQELDRAALRKLIFENESEKQWLEMLLHPLIRDLMLDRIKSASSSYCILVSPLLLETDQKNLVQRILVIDVSVETQLERTLLRDQSNESTIKSIIASQIDRTSRLVIADDIINNEKPVEEISSAVAQLHQKYLGLSEAENE